MLWCVLLFGFATLRDGIAVSTNSLLNSHCWQVMARFAQDCARKASEVTRKLEVQLGPETSSLAFRFGLHSGPCTGKVEAHS